MKGFTLIELLVVIAIISLLSSIVLVSLQSARQRGRDARRLQDMQQVRTALELHYADNANQYPVSDSDGCGNWDVGNKDLPFIGNLDADAMTAVPVDLVATGDCDGYRYYRYNPSYGCIKPFFVLGVTDMETSGIPNPDSPGWSCNIDFSSGNPLSTVCLGGGVYGIDCFNWQPSLEWVTGGFE